MASITEYEQKLLTSVALIGPLEAAHFRVILDAIDTAPHDDQSGLLTGAYAHLRNGLLRQMRATGLLGEADVGYISAALEVRLANHNGAVNNGPFTRAAIRRLAAVWPQSTVEGLVVLLCD